MGNTTTKELVQEFEDKKELINKIKELVKEDAEEIFISKTEHKFVIDIACWGYHIFVDYNNEKVAKAVARDLADELVVFYNDLT